MYHTWIYMDPGYINDVLSIVTCKCSTFAFTGV